MDNFGQGHWPFILMSQDELDELFAEEAVISSSEEALLVPKDKNSDEELVSDAEINGSSPQIPESLDTLELPPLNRPSTQGLIVRICIEIKLLLNYYIVLVNNLILIL